MINNVFSLVQQAALEKGLRLLVNSSEEIAPCLVGDQLRLTQILANLLGNGVKFTEQGEIELSVVLITGAERTAAGTVFSTRYRHVSGLDIDAALLRLNGKVKMYMWLVRSFIENSEATASIIADAVNKGDSELAARHAHSVKGSAGTIGAVELEVLAQTLETAITNGDPSETIISGSLRHFAAELDRLVVELARTDEPG